MDNTHAKSKQIFIEDGAFVGAYSIILKGSYIGKNAVIGARSVVCGVVPENEILGGNPARRIRKINDIASIIN